MHSALYVAKTGLSAQDTQLTTLSNNLSNAATVGFKRDRAVFEDLLYQIQRQPGGASSQDTQLPSGLQLGTGVKVVGTQKEFTQGSLQNTNQVLDLAISGRGFFEILLPDGTIGYTRNGQFHMDRDGQVVSASGHPLQPSVTVPQGATTLTVAVDGTVTVVVPPDTEPTQIGTLTIADFINPAGLQSIGENTYIASASSGNVVQGTPGEQGIGAILQNTLENSNVDVVEELVNMITTQRTYEMNSKVISTADQMLQFISQNL